MSGRYGNLDYPTLTKRSFAAGLALLALGVFAEVVSETMFGPLPGWEQQLFTSMEFLGVLIALLSPFVFGIALPLTE